jgi:hypothetical protein
MAKKKVSTSKESKKFPLPKYPSQEDIYSKGQKEELDDEELPAKKKLKEEERTLDEGLDIPGAELDDENERIGEEDEENNYYSLGGDNHEDLEADKL